jgi:malonyl CoA-acyl carrier protein transacylase
LIELAMAHGGAVYAPGGVVAQVWRDGSRQVRVARLLGSGLVHVQALDREEAQGTGALCGKSGTRDVVDASVVLLARRHGAAVVTGDPEDLERIDPGLALFVC